MPPDITFNWREQRAAWRMLFDRLPSAVARIDTGIVDDGEWDECLRKLALLGLADRLQAEWEERNG